METVSELLQGKARGAWIIGLEAPVFDAPLLMARRNVGALPVVNGKKLVGIISERDYARKVILHGKSSRDTPVKEIMTQRVVCVKLDDTIDECMALMSNNRIRHLPVIENDQLIGVLSIGDLVKETIAQQQFTIHQLKSYIYDVGVQEHHAAG